MHTVSWHSVSTTLDECIKCNICTSYCPVAAVTDKFPGPKYVGPQAQRFREIGQVHTPDHSVDYCSACRVCNEVCPAGVKIAEINARAKAQIVKDKGIPLRNWFLGRNEMLGKIGSLAPQLANLGMHNPISRYLAEKVMGIARHAPIPHWSTQGTFESWFKRTQRLKSDKKVVYFHGCSTEYYEPCVGQAAVAVLEHNGYEVIVPPQNCCGLPMLNNGEFPAAEKLYRQNLAHLLPYADQGYPIVGTSISCVLVLREEASEMLDLENDETHRLKVAMWDMMEFLRELNDNGELVTGFSAHSAPMVLPYHVSCQTRAHRMGRPALDVMTLIPGLDIREGRARCCGLAGTYGYKAEKYDIAMKVGQEAFDFINDQGPEARMVVSDSEICRWQLQHGTGKPTRHAVEVLAAAYGLYDLEGRRLTSPAFSV